MPSESATGIQSDGSQPELGASIVARDVHMQRLRPVARVEEEPIWPYSENRRHRASFSRLTSSYLVTRLPPLLSILEPLEVGVRAERRVVELDRSIRVREE